MPIMTKLFQKIQVPQKSQQARQSFGSTSSISSSNSSIRMESTRPSIYLHNKSSRRSGANKYTCSPKLTMYFQDMKNNGPQLRHHERRASRQSSFLLRQELRGHSSSSFLAEQLGTNQGTSEAFVDRRSSLRRASSIRNLGLKKATGANNRNDRQERFHMGDYLDDNEFSLSMFQHNGNK